MGNRKTKAVMVSVEAKANDRQVGGDHYQGGIQHWDYVDSNDIPYLEAQAIKYIGRHAYKNGLQDLEKAEHFLQKIKERYDD